MISLDFRTLQRPCPPSSSRALYAQANPRRGSVLIIVLVICLGLVGLTLYFANSMSSELRAADNRVVEVEARQAVAGATRYAGYVLSQFATGGAVPEAVDYQAEALAVGDATFWFIGRARNTAPTTEPVFGLVDEASKLNLNTATRAMLEALPGMTPELADAIVSWRSANAQSSASGNADNAYGRLDPARRNKAAPFESVDELRLVYGFTLDVLFGEDLDRNGALDANEDDGESAAPRDDHNGQLLAGILEYVTVYSRQPNTRADGSRRVNIATQQGRQQLGALLRQRGIAAERAQAILAATGEGNLGSVAEFMVTSGMTTAEFDLVHADLTASNGASAQGLINVNTASQTVLACIPGIGVENAATLVAYREAHPDALTSFAWIREVLNRASIVRAGQYLTDQSYQFSADIAAVGRNGRGYCREKVIYDMSAGSARIVYRQDLSACGWALGGQVRQTMRGSKES